MGKNQKFNNQKGPECSGDKKDKFVPSSNKRGRSNKGKGTSKDTNNNNKSGNKSYTDGNINNPAYYYEDANVLSQVMNFSFNEFGGVPIDLNIHDLLNSPIHNVMLSSVWINPSIPQSTGEEPFKMDGVTTAALRNFLALSGSNAKTTNYAPQDVVLLTLALADLIKATTFCARAFGVAYLFNYRNRSYPEMLLECMGINADDFSHHLADYRVRYNKLLTVAAKIPFPADLPIFRKAADLFAYIYLDDPSSALAQTYMLCPYSLWKFNEEYNEHGAGLETFSFMSPTMTMDQVLDNLEEMISALVNSTSLNAIYSDVMRLAQNGKLTNLITFKSIPEDFVVAPVYNEEVRDWLHNAVIVGAPIATADQYFDSDKMQALTNSNDVSCDASSNRVLYHPQFNLSGYIWGKELLIDFTHDNVSLEDKVRATRFSQRFTVIEDSAHHWYTNDLAFNDEYIVEIRFMTGENDLLKLWLTQSFDDLSRAALTKQQIADINHVLSKFDWAPLFYWKGSDQVYVTGDLDYYTILDYSTVRKIYDYEIIHFLQIG